MSQSIKSLLSKPEALSVSPGVHVTRLAWCHVLVILILGRQAQVGSLCFLASQLFRNVSSRTRAPVSKGWAAFLKMTPMASTCTHAHVHPHTHTHTCRHTKK